MTAPGTRTGRECAGSDPGSGGRRATWAASGTMRRAALPRAAGVWLWAGGGRAGTRGAGQVRAGAHPPDLVAAARRQPGLRHRGAGDRVRAARRAGLAAAAGSGAAAGTSDVRDSAAVPDRGVDAQRVLP